MDEIRDTDFDFSEKRNKKGLFVRIKEAFLREAEQKRGDKFALACDLTLFAVGFILSRCHLLFGARPLGLAFAAVLPVGVWSALGGAVIGSLTLGEDGIIFAAVASIAVFLRAMLSDRARGEAIFTERLSLRMAVAVLGGFVAAVYEVLLYGIDEKSLFFGLSMIVLPPSLVFVFSGLFTSGITLGGLLSSEDVFSTAGQESTERYNAVFFRLSALALLFFISLGLSEVEFFGISASYIFCAFATLLVAKRFGALNALAVGFVSSIGTAEVYSTAFALLGVSSGVMFSFGVGYALVIGGAALSAWGVYYAGLTGFLTTLPEYLIASALATPLLKRISETKSDGKTEMRDLSAEDMVGTMALAYQSKYSGSMDYLETTLSAVAGAVRSFSPSGTVTEEDYKALVIDVSERLCSDCYGQNLCTAESIRPCLKNSELLAAKLARGEKITAEDVNTDTEFCDISGIVSEFINREAARLEREKYKKEEADAGADGYELISRLVAEAKCRDSAETAVDSVSSELLGKILSDSGISDAAVRVFGERRRHIIMAFEDGDGSVIASKKLREDIEGALSLKLGTPEFFRRGKMALMECDTVRAYSVKSATASRAGSADEVSGDTSSCFESCDDYFYSLISDGMGKGDVAKDTSGFVADYVTRALSYGADKETVIHLVNSVIRSRGAECSATVDIFELDLITGDSTFIKSGAASSYVKRDNSIFRIRSRTAPIGLMKSIDTEKIRVEIKPGDYVIMLSDGIVDSFDDAPWLLELLSREAVPDVTEYARLILELAVKNATSGDDMSVTVIKVGTSD